MFSPCGVNGGNPRGCLAGKDLRPKGSRLDVTSLQVSIPSFDTDFDEPKMNQREIGEKRKKNIEIFSSRCPLDFDNGAWSYGKKQEEYHFPNSTTTRSDVSLFSERGEGQTKF